MKTLILDILGSITILDSSFDGFQQIYDNFTFGPRYPAMDPSRLVALSSLKEVTGFLNIQAHHPNFTSLDAFRNLVRKSSYPRGRSVTILTKFCPLFPTYLH